MRRMLALLLLAVLGLTQAPPSGAVSLDPFAGDERYAVASWLQKLKAKRRYRGTLAFALMQDGVLEDGFWSSAIVVSGPCRRNRRGRIRCTVARGGFVPLRSEELTISPTLDRATLRIRRRGVRARLSWTARTAAPGYGYSYGEGNGGAEWQYRAAGVSVVRDATPGGSVLRHRMTGRHLDVAFFGRGPYAGVEYFNPDAPRLTLPGGRVVWELTSS